MLGYSTTRCSRHATAARARHTAASVPCDQLAQHSLFMKQIIFAELLHRYYRVLDTVHKKKR
jgi:hypothetical protein